MRSVLVLLALSACAPSLSQQSLAPPGRAARLEEVMGFWSVKYYKVEVSQGVALALTCDENGPCRNVNVVSDDPAIAETRPASLVAMQAISFTAQAPASAFVIVGKHPGTTRLHVHAKRSREIVVTVVAPPPPANEQKAATAAR